MSLKVAIVGLPNVGKSTLFNALTKSKGAEAANYPFCTIDPNIGIVEVPDKRLEELNKYQDTQKILPTAVEFVDIAGLVAGASKGEGLGNKFLSHIRECAVIAQVVRVFEDENVTHVHEEVNPKRDIETIEAELIMADLQTVENRLGKAKSNSKSGDKEKIAYAKLLEKVKEGLESFKLAKQIELDEEEIESLRDIHLLTMKPIMYIVNLHEDEVSNFNSEDFIEKAELPKETEVISICAKIEAELLGFSDEEATDFLQSLGLDESGLNAFIHAAYRALNLITYFTVGEKEIRAWTVRKGSTAPQAAGVIHTDFEAGFIRAEVISYEDFVKHGGESKAKEAGALRLEGKEYITQDGDVMHFRFSS